jgi:hypothetical protein
MVNKKLNRDQWFQHDDQKQFILKALLSEFGYSPDSKWEAMKLADNLLNTGWEELEI